MSSSSLSADEFAALSNESRSQVLPELWISFVSLTRSHLGALQATGKLLQVKLQEISINSFIMGDLDGNIAVSIHPVTGSGNYETKNCGGLAFKGTWQLNANGSAFIGDGEEVDMELAVEWFAQKLVAARSEGATR